VLTRMSVRDGQLVLPDGMSYRVLVLPERPAISVSVLRKVKELAAAGATVIGTKPQHATGLQDFPDCDAEVARLAKELWGDAPEPAGGEHRCGQGRVIWGRTAREVLLADGVSPDFEFTGGDAETVLDYIHRRDGDAEIYFVANRGNRGEEASCTFRVSGKVPELFDPLTGQTRPLSVYSQAEGRTTVPLQFAPCGSWFVVFRKPAAAPAKAEGTNFPALTPAHTLAGSWQVRFDPRWGGPESVEFAELTDWTKRAEDGIRFYSGTATYRQTFDLPDSLRTSGSRLILDLGVVKQLAQVRLNGHDLGVLWAAPFRVDLTDAIRPTGNALEIEVVNFWPNRVIGDQSLPEDKRLTRTNVRKLTKDTPLVESGLLGPVQLLTATKDQ